MTSIPAYPLSMPARPFAPGYSIDVMAMLQASWGWDNPALRLSLARGQLMLSFERVTFCPICLKPFMASPAAHAAKRSSGKVAERSEDRTQRGPAFPSRSEKGKRSAAGSRST